MNKSYSGALTMEESDINIHETKHKETESSTRNEPVPVAHQPSDDKSKLEDENSYRGMHPKKVGIFSSGGLSNKIVEKIKNEYSELIKFNTFETKIDTFDKILSLTVEEDRPIPGPKAKPESDDLSEPSVVDQDKIVDNIITDEVKKTPTFSERAHKIFYELKKRLGLIKSTDERIRVKDVSGLPRPRKEPESQQEPEETISTDQEPEPISARSTGAKLDHEQLRNNLLEIFGDKDLLFIVTCLDDENDIDNTFGILKFVGKFDQLTIVIASLPRYFGRVENIQIMNKILQRLRLSAGLVILIPYFETIDFKLIPSLIQELLTLITEPGLINLDVADLKIIVKGGNVGVVTFGTGYHGTRAKDAFFEALDSKLLNVELPGVQKALLNVTGGQDMTLGEVEAIAEQIKRRLKPNARLILGARINPDLKDIIKLFLILGVPPMQVLVNRYATE